MAHPARIGPSPTLSGSYTPGWVDVCQQGIERLPWPWWLTYGGAWLLLAAVETLLKWAGGAYPVGTFFPYHLVAMGTGVFALAFIHFLDKAVERALTTIRPVLDLADDEIDTVRYRLTTTPATGTIVATLLGVAAGLLQRVLLVTPQFERFEYATSGFLFYYELVVIVVFTWALIGVFVYYLGRQLRLIDRLYRRHAVVNLFDAGPLYAFSRFSAQVSVGILLIGYLWIAAYPTGVDRSLMMFMFSTLGVLLSLALVTFLGPIWGAHQRLVEEKERRTSEVYADLETTMRELHRDAEAHVYERADGLTKTLGGLSEELALLEKVSTWPWRMSTLRGFLSAVFLPLFLWFAQQVLSRSWETWGR